MDSNQYAIELVTYLLVLIVYFYELIVYNGKMEYIIFRACSTNCQSFLPYILNLINNIRFGIKLFNLFF